MACVKRQDVALVDVYVHSELGMPVTPLLSAAVRCCPATAASAASTLALALVRLSARHPSGRYLLLLLLLRLLLPGSTLLDSGTAVTLGTCCSRLRSPPGVCRCCCCACPRRPPSCAWPKPPKGISARGLGAICSSHPGPRRTSAEGCV